MGPRTPTPSACLCVRRHRHPGRKRSHDRADQFLLAVRWQVRRSQIGHTCVAVESSRTNVTEGCDGQRALSDVGVAPHLGLRVVARCDARTCVWVCRNEAHPGKKVALLNIRGMHVVALARSLSHLAKGLRNWTRRLRSHIISRGVQRSSTYSGW